jgi:hypothetical protein
MVVNGIARQLAYQFMLDNPRFDTRKFLLASGAPTGD